MSLYNMLFGNNPAAPFLLEQLDLDQADKKYTTGRFRDIFFNNEDPKNPKVILYTRNGGGNRPDYLDVFDNLSTHPNYIKDYDDDFDSTYAYIEFTPTPKILEYFKGVETGKVMNVDEKFKAEMERMENGGEVNPEMAKFMENLMSKINQ